MANINFNQIGSINDGTNFYRPTNVQFGSDGRLYATSIIGIINAFTVEKNENGQYIIVDTEQLTLPNGEDVVKSILNHNDDGTVNLNEQNRLVTGLVVAGTADNPVLYVSSADPRRAAKEDKNLDTNSGVVTRVTWTGTEWEALDIVRGLPRSEESHSINGLSLNADGTKLLLNVGGNTNNGAPSAFFAFSSEYALTASVLEIDLADIEQRPILTDPNGGQNNTSRQYVYDLPTLDDPNIPNDGVREDANGLDTAGPWGGNDGLNQAVLPADAPLRIFADGLRNNYDLVRTTNGIFTIDNGSNVNVGASPVDAAGITTGEPGAGEATNTIVAKGAGDNEPLFRLIDGGYYGHGNPTRSNQDLAWTVYAIDGLGNGIPDPSLSVNSVPDISALVPIGVDIPEGFLIHPSKFTDDPDRLKQSGVTVLAKNADETSGIELPIATLGKEFASTNGVIQYKSNAFDGALQDALIATDLSGQVTVLNLNNDGSALEPLIDPGDDEELGTNDDIMLSEDGIYTIIDGISSALDITEGPDGTLWVASLFGGEIVVYEPTNIDFGPDLDVDNDGLDNAVDPFIRDANNGRDVILSPGQTLEWDLDEDLDGNLPGPGGYAAGLTGLLINGVDDLENNTSFGNVKFVTASGGGTVVIEEVSNGDPFTGNNDGEFLFHTGLTIDPDVEIFTVKWTVNNPAGDPNSTFNDQFQQIGGYLSTGDQSNYLKIVATPGRPDGEIQVFLENNDTGIQNQFLQADNIFTESQLFLGAEIEFGLEIDRTLGTFIPQVTYQTNGGSQSIIGTPTNLTGTNVWDVIQGNYTAPGDSAPTGLAVGLFSTNAGQPQANTFSATFKGIEVFAEDVLVTPTAQLSIDDIIVNEGDGTATFTVTLSGPVNEEVTVDYNSANGTAIAGNDYTATSGTLVFSANTSTQTLTIPVDITDDNQTESNETFTVNLSNVSGAAEILEGEGTGTATIIDNDSLTPTELAELSINDIIVNEGDGTATFTVTLSGPVNEEVTVDYNSANGTAIAGNDYTATSGTLVFSANTSTQTLTIPVDITDDNQTESNETFTVNLSNVSGAAEILEGEGTGTATIIDNDSLTPTELAELSINDIIVNEGDGTATFTVTLSGPVNEEVTVDYNSANGTAIAGNDYTATSGTLVFSANTSTQTLTIPVDITDDNQTESNETFTVNLSNVSGAAEILEGEGTGTATITDNDQSPADLGVLYRLNVGGETVAAPDGDIPWVNDGDFLTNTNTKTNGPRGGNVDLSSPTIPAGADLDTMYRTVRFDPDKSDANITYDFDVPSGTTVEVRFLLMEWWGFGAIGFRSFDIGIEGAVPSSLDDIDISALTGGKTNKGVVVSHTQTIEDGELNIELLHGSDGNPWISGIEIINVGEAPPTVSVANLEVNEVAGTADVTVSLSEALSNQIEVDYSTSDSTATAGSDYTATSGTLVFEAGQQQKTISVPINPDALFEGDESFEVVLSNLVGEAVLENGGTGIVTIIDDDPAPVPISINDIVVSEQDGTATFTVSLSEAINQEFTIDYATSDGTATAGSDYTATSGTLTFAANSTSQTVTIDILDDSELDPNESFTISLSNPSANEVVALGKSVGEAIIVDDEQSSSGVLYRLNVGGETVAAPDGDIPWVNDGDFLTNTNTKTNGPRGGNVDLSSPTIPAGADLDTMYRTVRFDPDKSDANITYDFDVPSGTTVEVRFLLMEWWGFGAIGFRSFDIGIEGAVPSSLDDIDISALTGGKTNKGVVVSHTQTIEDGELNIELLHGSDGNPWVSGIEIVSV
ncbi:Calx-beta domain-containing protein [Crocosphaera sp. Alani8]|uniref:Calx-beta domain-containing protein n=1 Tax=Crocosphaera sp. Alani8 TaxID=3038952 RepID=UPI00313D98B6